ncbi:MULTISPECIES: tyrosine-type recombinase/integrase [Pseudomonas]|uniref:Tyrosine-type recombinase/integrase n=1 Tax=Pseudomonas sp. W17 TaxID=3144407 RepID=A0AAU7X193_9PSED|nr:tyrosine-type recombinase/integrase [Pseudomonas protegens]AQT08872.1 integrase [Pseudomonas protegens]KTC39974.1 recombinase XerD [Pseudomonas sp. ABAC61]MCD9572169.1 tyrosine-type recombinase/integrase [Pseudomonas protegens]GED78412.1 integrase [Pseudomonas fluorescens]
MAPPRARTAKNRALPANLYPNGKYWQYKNPVTGKKTSINKPMAEAIKLANAANAKLLPLLADDGALLAMLTGEAAPKFSACLDRFEKEWLGTRNYAERTLKEIKFKLARYRDDLGDLMMGQLDVLTVAEYLDGFENNAYTKHRGLLVQIFAFAVAKGLCERNSAELTLVKKEAEKKRQRHTVEGLNTILNYVGTPVWLKRAIRLGLLSLQRREDIVMWPKSAVDLEQNIIKVSPGKTQNYGKPVHLEIAMGPALREVVAECMRSPVVCPYLIHYSPKARKRSQLDAKLHWNAVTPDYLTKSFAQARDDSEAYKDVPAGERPTFHEIRALGAWLYEQQGFPQEYIQGLMGHADVKMTEHYQSGHGDEAIVYMKVKADLNA